MRPVKAPGYLVNSLLAENRFGKTDCTFPIAYAYGDQSFLCSESGAEEILNMMKEKNDGQIALFKIEKAGHNIASENHDATFKAMRTFFDGEANGIW